MDLFDSLLTAALTIDPDGAVSRVGAGWEAVFEWSADELMGKAFASLAVEDHQGRIERAIGNVRRGAPSAIVRAWFPRPEAELRLMLRMQIIDGTLTIAAEDVKARAAVIERESKMENIVDFAADAWFIHDLEGRIRDANPWACKSLGYSRDEMLELRVSDFETTIRPGRLDGVWNRMEIGKPKTVQGRQRRKDGTTFPVEVRLGLFADPEDEVLMLAICRDISERVEREEELARVNTELAALNERLEDEVAVRTREVAASLATRQAMIDCLADGLIAVDRQGRITASNPALFALLDLSEEISRRDLQDALPRDLAQVIEAGARGDLATAELALPGRRTGVAVATSIWLDGRNDGAVALLRDVTAEKEIDRMKTEFIATVSHELRTPLTSVLGFAKIIGNRLESRVFPHVPEDDSRSQRAVEQIAGNIRIIVAEAERLTALINDVLDISKMESGKMEWKSVEISPAELIGSSVSSCAGIFEGSEVSLQTELDETLPTIHGDFARLHQVLVNLISNAEKFTLEGTVTVTAWAVPGGVEIGVVDTGMGVERGKQDTIFEKFKQVGDTLTNKPKGTGLGLPICKQIVEAHNGHIWVESEPGLGSRFVFRLPAENDQVSEPERNVAHVLRQIERRARVSRSVTAEILVVDDDPSLRELLRQQLTDRGYGVRTATDGYAAIEAIREKRPDLVILDVMMPQLSGFDVAAMLKSNPATEDIPIIILSILTDEEQGLRLGVDRYLTKPTTADELIASIEGVLVEPTSPKRVLVVDDRNPAASDITRLLTSKGYEVVGSCSGAECLEEARRTRADMIIVESLGPGHSELIRSIRFERDLEHVLVVQVMDD